MSMRNRRTSAVRVVARAVAVSVVGLSPVLWAGAAHAALPPGCTGTATAGDDVITCPNGVPAGEVVNSLGGNDRITVTGKVEGTISAGAGRDTVIITGTPGALTEDGVAVTGTVRGGTGNDTLTITGPPGSGTGPIDDGMAVSSEGRVYGDEGDDVLTLSGGNGSQEVGGTSVNAGAGVAGQVRGGAGADRITVRGGNGGPGGNGGTGVTSLGSNFGIGAVYGGDPGLLDAADGADIITITGGNGGRNSSTVFPNLAGGSALTGGKVYGDRGDDHITLTGGNGSDSSPAGPAADGEGSEPPAIRSTIEGGAGSDRIDLNRGAEGQDSTAVTQTDVHGGGQILGGLIDGGDTITVGTPDHPERGQTNQAAFNGDAGNDTITLHGTAGTGDGEVTVDGGTGLDTCGKESSNATFTNCTTLTP